MKILKKALCFCLLSAMLLTAVACGETYKPQKSTEEENTTVFTLTYGKKTYDVKYELYRALFLTYRDAVDGGDTSVWTDERAEAAKADINRKIFRQITDIYAVIALCDEVGCKLYGKEADKEVQEYIRESVEGLGDDSGYGTYDAFLASLKERNLNYAVFDLLCRYEIGRAMLSEYYFGTKDEYSGIVSGGTRTVTEEELAAFFADSGTARVLMAYLSRDAYTKERAEAVRTTVAVVAAEQSNLADREAAVADYLLRHTAAVASYIEKGQWISAYSLDDPAYDDLAAAVAALAVGEVGDLVELSVGSVSGYYLVYRAEKTDDMLTSQHAEILAAYKNHLMGQAVRSVADALSESMTTTSFFDGLRLSDIHMS